MTRVAHDGRDRHRAFPARVTSGVRYLRPTSEFMMAMKSVNKSFGRFTVFGEIKVLLHKLMRGKIFTNILNLSDEMVNAHG